MLEGNASAMHSATQPQNNCGIIQILGLPRRQQVGACDGNMRGKLASASKLHLKMEAPQPPMRLESLLKEAITISSSIARLLCAAAEPTSARSGSATAAANSCAHELGRQCQCLRGRGRHLIRSGCGAQQHTCPPLPRPADFGVL